MYRKLVVAVYEGERVLGEAEVHPRDGVCFGEDLRELRVSHYSAPSERCLPLAVLHTVNPAGICFKLDSAGRNKDSPLSHLHSACLRENKTAVVSIRGEEIHLVAMHSRKYEGQVPCFWGFKTASSLYNSCLSMLNLRCLGIVFDLDETLIVANTMRSFEDRIEALQRRITSEYDPQRISGMMAEVKRYQDDKNILKQYAESDQVIDTGKIIKSQSEVVPSLSDSHPSIMRPLIRLQDRNIILTRINPLIRDTSVLVRLRPAWEDFRSYLTARGRKRFEVFVCTMAERDYALEMWRLLDPESNLIDTKELLDRIVCVKSGSRKSLFNVFRDRNFHPKMALVIDDRLKVWDDRDQPRVHVVPPFAPYFAPQAEANNTVPVLCVARNVACNVRGGFFKEFDDGLLQQISKVAYEDEIKDVLSPPDVSNYLVSEDDPAASIGNKNSLGRDGMADAEVEKRLKEANSSTSTSPAIMNLDPRITQVLQHIVQSSAFTIPVPTIQGPAMPFPSQQLSQMSTLKPHLAQVEQVDSMLHSSSATEEGEVPESELDPDTRRRLLILQHGQDIREQPPTESQIPARPSMEVSAPRVQPRCWFPLEEKINSKQPNQVGQSKEFPLPADPFLNETSWAHHHPLHKVEPSIRPGRALESHRSPKEALHREEQSKSDQPSFNTHYFSANRDPDLEAGQTDSYTETYTEVLQDIAFKCGTNVEFKQTLVSSSELQFLVEVLFAGEKIGHGVGKTRREAQCQAAEGSLLNLADKYLSQCRPDSGYIPVNQKDNGAIIDTISLGYQSSPKDGSPRTTVVEPSRNLNPRMEASSNKPLGPIADLQELCMVEGLSVAFQTQPQVLAKPGPKSEMHAQVEINGQILGKGTGQTWDEAKSQAAEKAIVAVKSMLSEFPYRHHGPPRYMQGFPNKRARQDFSRAPR